MTDKLNLGCGRDIREGWINADLVALPGVNMVVDLDQSKPFDLDPWEEGEYVDEFVVSHLIEHIHHPLNLLQAMWDVATPDALAVFHCPYGSSDDADEDPTHVRRMFIGSWGYFSQPYYWRADYGYRGDWWTEKVVLYCDPKRMGDSEAETFWYVRTERNVVLEMEAHLRAVKPRRSPDLQLQRPVRVELVSGPRTGG